MQNTASSLPPGINLAELTDRLRPVMLKLSRHLRREAQKVGMSGLDAQLLGVIKANPGMGISELADLEQVSRPAMSVHVKRLEKEGWLTRTSDHPSADKRRVQLSLSDKGLQAWSAIRRSRNDWLQARLSQLSNEELAALSGAIGPLVRLVEMKI